MKLSHRIIPFLLAIPVLLGFWACSDSSKEVKDSEEITALKNQLREELATISSDSLSSHTIWVAPEVNMTEDRFLSVDSWPFIVGIIGIICGCAVPIGIVAVIMSSLNTRRRYEMHAVEMAISRNYPLPPEFFRSKTLHQLLYRSVVWIGIGVGCWYFAVVTDNWDMSWIGIFPFFIGLANLALFLVRRRENSKSNAGQPIYPTGTEYNSPDNITAEKSYSGICTPSDSKTNIDTTDSGNAQ